MRVLPVLVSDTFFSPAIESRPQRYTRSKMKLYILLSLVIVLLLLGFTAGATPQIVDATYEIKTAVIAGTEYKAAVFNMDFDQDMHVLENFPCQCGSCSSTTLPAVNETGYEVTPIELNTWAEGELVGTGTIKYYKFSIDSSLACHNVYVESEIVVGFIAVYVSSKRVPVTDDYDWYRPVSGRRYLPLCNAHSAFGVGTYYVGVRANNFFNIYNRFKLRVVTQTTGTCPPERTMPDIPAEYPTPFQWLQDGAAINAFANPGVYDYYGYSVDTQCTRFAVSAHKNTSLVGDVDIYVSTVNHDIGFRRPLDFRNDWLSNLDGEDSITFYRCSETVPWTIFVAVTAYDLPTGYDVVATTQDSTFVFTQISSMELNSPQNHLARTFRVECTDENVAENSERFFCEFPAYDRCLTDAGFYCCYPMYPVAAIETTNPFWPWNAANSQLRAEAQIDWSDMNFEIDWIPNRISFAVLISTRFDNQYVRYAQSEDFSTCKVVWLGQITNIDGEAISADVTFTAKQAACTSAIDDLVHGSTEIIDQMSQSTDYLELTKSHFLINFEYLKEDWAGCNDYVLQFGEATTLTESLSGVRACLHFPNSTAFNEDPCCNTELQFDQCCGAQPLSLSSTVTTANPNQAAIDAKCVTPSCSRKQVLNLASLQQGVNNLETGCTANFLQEANPSLVESLSSFVRDCQVKIWGEQLEGVKCSNDSDCYSNVCNKTYGQCEQGIEETLSCLADNVTPVVGRFLFNQWGILANVTKGLLVDQLRARFVVANQCVGPTSIRYRDNYWWSRDEATCSDDCLVNDLETHCLDTLCPILPTCDYQQLGLCYRNWYFTKGRVQNCLTDKTCNWLSCAGLTDSQCQTSCNTWTADSFCGDCRSGTLPCKEMTDRLNEGECSAGVCSVDPAIAPNQCANFGSCSALCNGVACSGKNTCELSGTCSDLAVFADFIATINDTVTGVCLSPNVFSLDGSAVCDESTQIQTAVGCAELNVDSEVQCNGASQRWWNFATTQDECTFVVCQESYNGNSFSTWKSPAECTNTCEGKSVDALTWTPGVWSPGTIEPLVWLPRSYSSVNKLGSIFDFISFRQAINNAIVNRLAFAYTTEALCRYDSLVKSVSYLACDCNADIYDGDCAHSDLTTSYLIGALAACPYIESTLNAPPAFLTVFADTISQNSFCKAVQIDRLSASFYQVESTLALSSEIYNKRLFNTFSVVLNSKGATIGQIVTDGISVKIDDGSALASTFELCIAIDSNIGVYSEYTQDGIGVLDAETNRIYSTEFDVTRNGNQICTLVFNGTYFGIARLPDWQDEEPFDQQQTQMKWAGVAFYFAGVVFGLFQLIIIAINQSVIRRTRTKKLIFCAFTLAFLLLRGIYFTFPPTLLATEFVVQYLLFELPQFMFFSLYTIILFLWNQVLIKQSVVSKGRSRGKIRRALIGYMIANAFMYAVFITFVLVYRFWDSATAVCAFDIDTAATQDRFYITLAYRIFIAVVCFGVSLAFMIQGIKFIAIFRKSKMVNTSGKKSRVRILITFIACLCTALFIGRTIVFLYAAVTGNQVVIIIFVLFEVLPCYALLYYLRPFESKDFFGVSADTSTHGSSANASTNSAKEYPYSNTTNTNHGNGTTNDVSDDGEEYPSDSEEMEATRGNGALRKSTMATTDVEQGMTSPVPALLPDIPNSSLDESSSSQSSSESSSNSPSSNSPSSD